MAFTEVMYFLQLLSMVLSLFGVSMATIFTSSLLRRCRSLFPSGMITTIFQMRDGTVILPWSIVVTLPFEPVPPVP